MSPAQRRFIDVIRSYGGEAAYWDVVNDWVKDKGPAASFAFRNSIRTVEALVRDGYIRLDDDGYFQLTERLT